MPTLFTTVPIAVATDNTVANVILPSFPNFIDFGLSLLCYYYT